MFRLFRILNLKIINKKIQTYLLYAFGEIILISVGILLALFVNNWNETRKNTKIEEYYLIGLTNDLKEQIRSLEKVIEHNRETVQNTTELLTFYAGHESFIGLKDLHFRLNRLIPISPLINFNPTYQELKSTGGLKLISNEVLRNEVIEFNMQSDKVIERINDVIVTVLHDQVQPIIYAYTLYDINSSISYPSLVEYDNPINIKYPDKLKSIALKKLNNSASELELINALNIRMSNAKLSTRNATYFKKKAEKLLIHIKKEINN